MTPTAPTGPSGPAPLIACSGDLAAGGRGGTQTVTYAAPTVTGGVAPVTTTCAPASGAAFPLGTNTVTCVATDAAAQTASCVFAVRVTGTQIGVKKFETLGDSLTEGENGLPFQISVIDATNAYPTKLRTLLDGAFPGQGIVVANRGLNGQRIEQTLEQLPAYLAADRPEVVLLLGGFNNLTLPCHYGITTAAANCDAAVEFVEDTLRECIRLIKRTASVRYVFVGTLTPPGPVAPNAARDLRIDPSAIAEVNSRIRFTALIEGAVLVDTYAAFLGNEPDYTSIDGLHLRPLGYQAIADVFFARILATVPQTSTAFVR